VWQNISGATAVYVMKNEWAYSQTCSNQSEHSCFSLFEQNRTSDLLHCVLFGIKMASVRPCLVSGQWSPVTFRLTHTVGCLVFTSVVCGCIAIRYVTWHDPDREKITVLLKPRKRTRVLLLLFSFGLLCCYMIVFTFLGLISVLVYCHAFESCKHLCLR